MYRNLCLLIISLLVAYGSCADLPTVYEYYTTDGISSGLSVAQPYFTLNGKNISIYSGALHYFRVPPQYWQDRLRKLRAAGLNAVETYIPWNLHEPEDGIYEFGNGGTEMQDFLNLEGFLKLAQEEDLLVIVRPGPYICAEFESGGFPSWLLRKSSLKERSTNSVYMSFVERYFKKLVPLLAGYQFTKGGSIIAVQVENEYGFTSNPNPEHIQQLYDLVKGNGIVELIFTSDPPRNGVTGSLPGVFQTFNDNDPESDFEKIEEIQPNKPIMFMEFYPGWFDYWTDAHNTMDNTTFGSRYKAILTYPASVNLYMFIGGTNFRFLNGAGDGSTGFHPVTTSYDFDGVLTEAGDYTSKYTMIKQLLEEYNPIKTLTPDAPELEERQVYTTLTIEGQLDFKDILQQAPLVVESQTLLSMEKLPINNESGQSYGYIVYHQENLNIPADSVLTITGYIHNSVIVLVNGVSINPPFSSSEDLDGFGFYRIANSTITLTTTDLSDATLDILIENWGRANYGNMQNQFKGLTGENDVYLNDQQFSSWIIYPLEFKKVWTTSLSGWKSAGAKNLEKGPGLYKATLTIDDDTEITDTFLDMQTWTKGIVIVNGFVLGRYVFIGPQETLYLPGPFLQHGDNEIVIFEHFEPVSEIKFSKDPIYSNP